MSALDALWAYQEADLKVDKYESEIRQNPMRKKLLRLKNYYKEQQDAMRLVEQGNTKAAQQIAQLQSQHEALREKLENATKAGDDAFESSSQARAAIVELNEIISRLSSLEQRTSDLIQELGKLNRDLRTARVNASKARQDYTELKEQYDKEFEQQSVRLNELTKARDSLSANIPPEFLNKYKAIKQRCTPPMAVLQTDKCGGCNMALPAVSIRNVHKPNALVECETCGRIIYANDPS